MHSKLWSASPSSLRSTRIKTSERDSENGPGLLTLRPRLLVVEHDHELAAFLRDVLLAEGYLVDVASSGPRALHLGLSRCYDALVMDRGVSTVDGLDLIAQLSTDRDQDAPMLVLSTRGLPQDRVEGLDAGAGDHMSRSFDVAELLERLRALRRRRRPRPDVLALKAGHLHRGTRLVELGGGSEPVELSEKEAEVLALLARYPSQVFTRMTLMLAAFPEAVDVSVVDTYVHYLRRKLGRSVIRTVRGVGYQLGRA